MLLPPRRLHLLALLLCHLALSTVVRAEWLHQEQDHMGTRVGVELWSEDDTAGQRLIAGVFAEFQRLDEMMNTWNPDSELSRINREAGRGAVTTTAEIIEVVERALHYARLSEGAFDISFAAVGQFYDYRQGRSPSEETLTRARQAIDYRAIRIDRSANRIEFTRPGVQIDLGGIAKGYAVDHAIALLQDAGIQSAVVSAGGDSRILGDLGERPRTVGIRHPRREGEFAVLIPLTDTAISTSGDYERFFIDDGQRIHHILDPGTGRSANSVQSASVLAPHAIDSDALSTAIFVLGVERGLALANRLPGVDAIIIDGEGKLHYSDELLMNKAP